MSFKERLGVMSNSISKKNWQLLLDRDLHRCMHCGIEGETLVIQHRSNRGHGGSNSAERASNYVVLCSYFNGLIESDAKAAGIAKRFGYKISRYDNTREMPVYDTVTGQWWLLNDDFTKERLIG